MIIRLHKQATTTPKIRAEIQASKEAVSVLAKRYAISEDTVYKWRKRISTEDRSHTPHRLQTVLTPAQELVVVELRKMLLLPLDDLLSVTKEFINPNVSRSGLDRCLRRHHVGRLSALRPKKSNPRMRLLRIMNQDIFMWISNIFLKWLMRRKGAIYLSPLIEQHDGCLLLFIRIKRRKMRGIFYKSYLNGALLK